MLCLAGPILVLALILVPVLIVGSAALALHEELVRSGYAFRCLGKTCLFLGSGDATVWWQP